MKSKKYWFPAAVHFNALAGNDGIIESEGGSI